MFPFAIVLNDSKLLCTRLCINDFLTLNASRIPWTISRTDAYTRRRSEMKTIRKQGP